MADLIRELKRKREIQKARKLQQQQEQERLNEQQQVPAIQERHSSPPRVQQHVSAIPELQNPPPQRQQPKVSAIPKLHSSPPRGQQQVSAIQGLQNPPPQRQQQKGLALPQLHSTPPRGQQQVYAAQRLQIPPAQIQQPQVSVIQELPIPPPQKLQQQVSEKPKLQIPPQKQLQVHSTSQQQEEGLALPQLHSSTPRNQQQVSAAQKLRIPPPQKQLHVHSSPPQQPQLSISNERVKVVHDKVYTLGAKLGSGGSSVVYEARRHKMVYALKVVDFENLDPQTVESYLEEVELLKELQGEDGIIQLVDYEVKDDDKELLVVLEKGESDFLTFLRSTDRSPNMVRYHFEQMLKCVKVIHSRNIVHSDLKPANLIFVRNKLKLIDFGIASRIPSDLTSVPKLSQPGTVNYMSPEAIQCRHDEKFHIPLASDIWSLGCILYSMVYGRPPFGHINNHGKVDAILNKEIEYKYVEDEQLLDIMKQCLQRDYQKRPSAEKLLEHPYLKPHSSTTTNSIVSSFSLSKSEFGGDEDSAMVGKIVDEVRNNTPRTAAKKVYKMLQEHSLGTN